MFIQSILLTDILMVIPSSHRAVVAVVLTGGPHLTRAPILLLRLLEQAMILHETVPSRWCLTVGCPVENISICQFIRRALGHTWWHLFARISRFVYLRDRDLSSLCFLEKLQIHNMRLPEIHAPVNFQRPMRSLWRHVKLNKSGISHVNDHRKSL